MNKPVSFIAYHGSIEDNLELEPNKAFYLCASYKLAKEFAYREVDSDGLYEGDVPMIYKFKGTFKNPYYMTEEEYDDEGQDSNIDFQKWVDMGVDGIVLQNRQTYYIVIDPSTIRLIGKKYLPFDEESLKRTDDQNNDKDDMPMINEEVDYQNEVEILLNPSTNEFKHFMKPKYWYRMCLDSSTDNVFVWDANTPLLHQNVDELYGLKDSVHLFVYNLKPYIQDYDLDEYNFADKEAFLDVAKSIDSNALYKKYFPNHSMVNDLKKAFENNGKYIVERSDDYYDEEQLDESVERLTNNENIIYIDSTTQAAQFILNKRENFRGMAIDDNSGYYFTPYTDSTHFNHFSIGMAAYKDGLLSNYIETTEEPTLMFKRTLNDRIQEIVNDSYPFIVAFTNIHDEADEDNYTVYYDYGDFRVYDRFEAFKYLPLYKALGKSKEYDMNGNLVGENEELDESIAYAEMNDDDMLVILHNPTRKELKDNHLDDECRLISDGNNGYYFASSEWTHEQIEQKLQAKNLPYSETSGEFYYYQDNLFTTRDDWSSEEEYQEYKNDWYQSLKSMPYIVKNFGNFKVEIFKGEYLSEEYEGLNRIAGFYWFDEHRFQMLKRKPVGVEELDLEDNEFDYYHLDDKGLEEDNKARFGIEKLGKKIVCYIESENKQKCLKAKKAIQKKFNNILIDKFQLSWGRDGFEEFDEQYISESVFDYGTPMIFPDPTYSEFHRIMRDHTTYGKLSAVIDRGHIYCWDSGMAHHHQMIKHIENQIGERLSDSAIWVRFKEPNWVWVSAEYFNEYDDDELDDLGTQDFEKELENNPIIKKYFPRGIVLKRFNNLVESFKKVSDDSYVMEITSYNDIKPFIQRYCSFGARGLLNTNNNKVYLADVMALTHGDMVNDLKENGESIDYDSVIQFMVYPSQETALDSEYAEYWNEGDDRIQFVTNDDIYVLFKQYNFMNDRLNKILKMNTMDDVEREDDMNGFVITESIHFNDMAYNNAFNKFEDLTVWKNPSIDWLQNELENIDLRFIYNPDANMLYVWNGSKWMHSEVMDNVDMKMSSNVNIIGVLSPSVVEIWAEISPTDNANEAKSLTRKYMGKLLKDIYPDGYQLIAYT